MLHHNVTKAILRFATDVTVVFKNNHHHRRWQREVAFCYLHLDLSFKALCFTVSERHGRNIQPKDNGQCVVGAHLLMCMLATC
jgi:hypothetical protein